MLPKESYGIDPLKRLQWLLQIHVIYNNVSVMYQCQYLYNNVMFMNGVHVTHNHGFTDKILSMWVTVNQRHELCNNERQTCNTYEPPTWLWSSKRRFIRLCGYKIRASWTTDNIPIFLFVEYTSNSKHTKVKSESIPTPTLKLCKLMEMDEELEIHPHSTNPVTSVYYVQGTTSLHGQRLWATKDSVALG